MNSRRQFNRLALVSLGVLSSIPVQSKSVYTNDAEALFSVFVVDPKFCPDRRTAQRIAKLAEQTSVVGEDVGAVWHEILLPQLHQRCLVMGGVTSGYSAFTLNELVRDYGYGIVYSQDGVHIRAPGKLDHDVLPATSLNKPDAVSWIIASQGINYRNQQA